MSTLNWSKLGNSLLVLMGAVFFGLAGVDYFVAILADWHTVKFSVRGFEFRGIAGLVTGAAFLALCVLLVVIGALGLFKNKPNRTP